MFDWTIVKVSPSRSIIPDITASIDSILDAGIVVKIYQNWDAKKYGELVDYGGGVSAITALMLRGAGEEFLVNIKSIGEKRAKAIMEVISEVCKEVPYL